MIQEEAKEALIRLNLTLQSYNIPQTVYLKYIDDSNFASNSITRCLTGYIPERFRYNWDYSIKFNMNIKEAIFRSLSALALYLHAYEITPKHFLGTTNGVTVNKLFRRLDYIFSLKKIHLNKTNVYYNLFILIAYVRKHCNFIVSIIFYTN